MKVSSASQYDSYYKESQSVIRIQNKLHFDVMIPWMSLSPGDKQTETGIFSDFFEFWSKTDFFSALSLRYLNLYMETLVVTFL